MPDILGQNCVLKMAGDLKQDISPDILHKQPLLEQNHYTNHKLRFRVVAKLK